MYNFIIIDQCDHINRNKYLNEIKFLMNHFLDKDKNEKDLSSPIFILANGVEKNLIGGAYFQKLPLLEIQEDLRELVSTFPLHGHVLQCSGVFLGVRDEKAPFKHTDWDFFCRSFYCSLYETMIELGKLNGVKFMIMKLTPQVYDLTKEFGTWPYVVQLKPHDSTDGLFHGILPLTGTQYTPIRGVN